MEHSSTATSSHVVLGRYASLEAFASALAFLDLPRLTPHGGALRIHPTELREYEGEPLTDLALCCTELGLRLEASPDLAPHRIELVARGGPPGPGERDATRAVLRPM